MKKRFLSLLCVLALCLGLLPVTALAVDAPATLYVGNNQVIVAETVTYWSTNDSGELTRVENATDASKDWTVRYNPNTATLTLNEAKISGSYDQYNNPFTAGIYAKGSSDQPVALTIELIGTNTITGNYGIYVDAQQGEIVGTNASLLIQNSSDYGILEVSGSSHGIYVKSGTGNASLTIKDASVVASSSSSYDGYAGVCVQSGSDATSSPKLSLAVDGGSLTTSASEGNDGIQFYVGSSEATGATTSLTVSDNAIVRANGGIKASRVDEPTPSGTGIVFDGNKGTVYGSVELQKDLEIKSGETLTIPEGSTLNTNNNLTNNGTIVNTGGTLNGEPDGTGKIETTPTIDTQPASQTVTKGNTATFTVAATGENLSYQWQQSINSGSNWMDISGANVATYTTAATTTSMSGYQYRCVVSNSAGSVTSEVATLTVNEPAPTTYTITADVFPLGAGTATADKTTATAGDMVKLTATANSGYRFTGWTFSDNITDTDSSSATTTFTMPAGDVTVTANFQQYYIITVNASAGGTATADKTTAVAGEAVTLTATPDSGYHFDRWNIVSGTITIQNNQFTMPAGNVEIQAIFDRNSSGGSSTPTKTPSQQAVDKIESAKDGSTVEIKLSTGSTKLDKEVFEELAGRDVTLEISLPGGVSWTVNGQDIPENADLTDLDLGVTLDASTIPVSVINTVTGAVDTIQLSLAHNGEFGFTMILSAPLGKTNAGYWANLYYYNTRTRALEFQSASKIATDGTASFPFSHASDYAIVIDTDSHEPVELPFTDVPEGAWYEDAAAYVYKHGLMAGTSATTFAPDVTTSRAMIATILWRMAGSPVVNYAMNYTDVAQGQWCSEAIRWATSEGVVTGYGNGLFGTNDPITREQLATMLWRYAQTKGYDVSIGENTNILSYTDVADLSEYAIPAMQWAVGAGIINGTGDGSTLTPQGQATRAQAAVMLQRFCEKYVIW